jgi:hypothetical protein
MKLEITKELDSMKGIAAGYKRKAKARRTLPVLPATKIAKR